MARSTTNYLRLLQSLLPKGKIWNREESSTLTQYLTALADEFSRLDERTDDILLERNVSTTTELVSEHEEDFGITYNGSDTLSERRDALLAKLLAVGQQDVSYFIEIAEAINHIITIDEFRPFWSGVGVAGDACGDQANVFYWKVNSDIQENKGAFGISFSSNNYNGIDKYDVNYVTSLIRNLDNLINEITPLKPAQSRVIYDFSGAAFGRGFYWGFNSIPHNDGSIPIEEYTSEFSNAFTSIGNYDGNYLTGGFTDAFCLSYDVYHGGSFSIEFGNSFRKPS
jgi:uncharacterized protein YmfQ (DUF2313 family)